MIAVRLASTHRDIVRRIVLVSATLNPCDGTRAVLCWKAIGAVGAAFRTLAPRTYRARVQEQYDTSVFPGSATSISRACGRTSVTPRSRTRWRR